MTPTMSDLHEPFRIFTAQLKTCVIEKKCVSPLCAQRWCYLLNVNPAI